MTAPPTACVPHGARHALLRCNHAAPTLGEVHGPQGSSVANDNGPQRVPGPSVFPIQLSQHEDLRRAAQRLRRAAQRLGRDGRLRLLAPRPAFASRRDPPHPHIVGLAAIGGVEVHHVRRIGIHGHEAQIGLASRRRDADLVPDFDTQRTGGLGLAGGRGRVHEAKELLKAVAALDRADGRAPHVAGGPMGEEACATVMPSDAFSASLTTADACKRRTSVWGGRADRGDIRGAVLILSLFCGLGGVDGGDVGGERRGPAGLRGGDEGHVGRGQPERDQIGVGIDHEVGLPRLKVGIGTGNVISQLYLLAFMPTPRSAGDSAARTSCPAHAALRHPTATRAVNRHAADTPGFFGKGMERLHQPPDFSAERHRSHRAGTHLYKDGAPSSPQRGAGLPPHATSGSGHAPSSPQRGAGLPPHATGGSGHAPSSPQRGDGL